MAEDRISIIIPVLNMEGTIGRALQSITDQQHHDVEIIVVDGGSTDKTLDQLQPFRSQISHVISEPDGGPYHAMNKGLKIATGDIIAILNADDYYSHNQVFREYHEKFANSNIGIVIGDLEFFWPGNPEKTIRSYSSEDFTVDKLRLGWMPPHPTTFARKWVYDQVGNYGTDYLISADFEFLIRALWVEKIQFDKISSVVVRMQYGGLSTQGIRATYILNREIIRACRSNGLNTGWATLLLKFPKKLLEFGAYWRRA